MTAPTAPAPVRYDDVPEDIDHDSPVFFFGEKRAYGEFSQWRRSTFSVPRATIAAVCGVDVETIEGGTGTTDTKDDTLVFGCAEQFMMFGKAVAFGDRAVQRAILATPDNPATQKKLGRHVANYTDAGWDAVQSSVVTCGNLHKFGQSEKLKRVLLATGNRLLVEAAPRDRVWGIGYGAEHALAYRDSWGENRLAWALMQLPPDFPQSAVDQFDRLRDQGLLFFFPSDGEVVCHDNFFFEFKISTSIAKKPVLSADAPERRGKGGPFVDPDPAFVVARPGPDHVVELSMHSMFRPHYVLHTRLFAPQTDDLDAGDWAATWAVMEAITMSKNKQKPMAIYNCGYEGGASQGHKHLQVFTEPEPGFALFPETVAANARLSEDPSAIARHPDVPFEHFVLPLVEEPVTPAYLLSVYVRLLAEVRLAHKAFAGAETSPINGTNGTNGTTSPPSTSTTTSTPTTRPPLLSQRSSGNGTAGHRKPSSDDLRPSTVANNVIVTPRWMCMVPRRRGGKDGTGAGSLGMLGLLWLKSQRERDHWTELGMTEHLVWMGLPRRD